MLTARELGWIAGFLEGEGCFQFHRSKTGGTPEVSVSQVQRAPLDRLVLFLGGKIRLQSKRPNDFYQWRCHGPRASGLMMTVFPLMSPRRKAQIVAVLAKWRSRPASFTLRMQCKRGHPFDDTNTRRYINYAGRPARECRTCRREGFGLSKSGVLEGHRLIEMVPPPKAE